MKKSFESFLRKHNFLPPRHWNRFELKHGKGSVAEKEATLKKIRGEVDKKSGLYIYKKGSKTLYAGKAKSLFDRIKSHYRESYEKVPGDTKDNLWHRFFSDKDNVGTVTVLWKEVNDEKERQILEKMLEYVLGPEFEKFRRRLKLLKAKNKKVGSTH